jgi:CubicO group peptidase (beta-lactamase class C family)
MTSKEFAQQYLATPLGFRMAYWSQDPQGVYFGGNDMEWTPRQMLAFGELYLNNGVHEGEQILPEEWVEQSWQAHATSPRGQGRFYGYGWWLRDVGGLQVPLAWGYGGQMIFVIRERNMVVVMTSESEPRAERFNHLRSLYTLVERYLL